MKKLLTLIIAAASISASAFLIEKDIPVNGDGTKLSNGPRTIKSAVILNNGAMFSVSESVGVSAVTDMTYNRPYKVLSNGATNSVLYDKVGMAFHFNETFYAPVVVVKIDSNDPNEYIGEFDGNMFSIHTGESEYYCRVKLHTYTDTSLYKVVYEFSQTNDLHSLYSYVPAESSGKIVCNNLPFILQNFTTFNKWNPATDDSIVKNFIVDGRSTNSVCLVNNYVKTSTNHVTELFSIAVGTNPLVITNGIDIMIPGGTNIKATSSDDQTKVTLIFE